jgi:hypothetical protein
MEAVPDDLFQHDAHTFPQMDPTVAAKQAQVNAAAEKELKARAAAEAKERKAEEALVKKSMALPSKTQKANGAAVDLKVVKNRELIAHKIRLYYKKLGHLLSSKEPKTLPKDDEGLAELLANIETELHSKGGIELASKLVLGVCFGAEQLNQQFNPFGLMLSGPAASFTNTVQANRKEWDDLVTEFAISNAEWFVVSFSAVLISISSISPPVSFPSQSHMCKTPKRSPKERCLRCMLHVPLRMLLCLRCMLHLVLRMLLCLRCMLHLVLRMLLCVPPTNARASVRRVRELQTPRRSANHSPVAFHPVGSTVFCVVAVASAVASLCTCHCVCMQPTLA